MATTTAAAIRNRAIAVIKALVPQSLSELRFIPWDNQGGADFRAAMVAAPAGAHRMFQVRTRGVDAPIEVTNEDVEEHFVELEVVVAYPADNAWGASGNALDRDDVIDQDRHAIEDVIGVRGSANFTAATGADACWREATNLGELVERYPADGIDFLVIRQTMSYFRAV